MGRRKPGEYRCKCGKERRKGERLCLDCKEARKQGRRDAKELAKKHGQYRPCPVSLCDRIMVCAEVAFEGYASWQEDDKGHTFKAACAQHSEAKQFHEGLPAVSAPYLWIEGSTTQNPRDVLANAVERLHRWDPASAKVPAAVDGRKETIKALGEPMVCVRESDWWAVMKEWAE